ncbi:MAG TPA: hypothetical protein VFU47_17215, partial [Armatimonadota bacterium]|nr:hypothetical protein [Armatimonadota bacterium]
MAAVQWRLWRGSSPVPELGWRLGERLALRGSVRFSDGVGPVLRQWTVTCASVLPGLGQLLGGRSRQGLALLAVGLLLLAGAAWWVRTSLSDALLLFLLLLSLYSVWDAAHVSFPPARTPDDGGRTLRAMKLWLLSLSVVLTTLVVTAAALGCWYGLWIVDSQNGA